ncbi:MAG: cation:proton antiporter subunit C [Pseudomonadota bacterium]
MDIIDSNLILTIAAVGLMLIGIGGIVISNHLVRIIFGIALLEAGTNLLLLLSTYHPEASAPIIVDGNVPALMADPVPQALVLTAIVIGVGILALALSLAIRVQRAYGTLDMREVRLKLEQEISAEAGVEMPSSSHAPAGVPAAAVTAAVHRVTPS